MSHTIRPSACSRLIGAAGLAGATLLLAACATVPEAPYAALAEAKVAIKTAEKDNAGQYAGPVLTEARQRLARANTAVNAKHMTEADRLAQESRVAAELASARTEAAKAAEVNDELNRGVNALAEEIRRAGEQ